MFATTVAHIFSAYISWGEIIHSFPCCLYISKHKHYIKYKYLPYLQYTQIMVFGNKGNGIALVNQVCSLEDRLKHLKILTYFHTQFMWLEIHKFKIDSNLSFLYNYVIRGYYALFPGKQLDQALHEDSPWAARP